MGSLGGSPSKLTVGRKDSLSSGLTGDRAKSRYTADDMLEGREGLRLV